MIKEDSLELKKLVWFEWESINESPIILSFVADPCRLDTTNESSLIIDEFDKIELRNGVASLNTCFVVSLCLIGVFFVESRIDVSGSYNLFTKYNNTIEGCSFKILDSLIAETILVSFKILLVLTSGKSDWTVFTNSRMSLFSGSDMNNLYYRVSIS